MTPETQRSRNPYKNVKIWCQALTSRSIRLILSEVYKRNTVEERVMINQSRIRRLSLPAHQWLRKVKNWPKAILNQSLIRIRYWRRPKRLRTVRTRMHPTTPRECAKNVIVSTAGNKGPPTASTRTEWDMLRVYATSAIASVPTTKLGTARF